MTFMVLLCKSDLPLVRFVIPLHDLRFPAVQSYNSIAFFCLTIYWYVRLPFPLAYRARICVRFYRLTVKLRTIEGHRYIYGGYKPECVRKRQFM
jgi:hypothetical protein